MLREAFLACHLASTEQLVFLMANLRLPILLVTAFTLTACIPLPQPFQALGPPSQESDEGNARDLRSGGAFGISVGEGTEQVRHFLSQRTRMKFGISACYNPKRGEFPNVYSPEPDPESCSATVDIYNAPCFLLTCGTLDVYNQGGRVYRLRWWSYESSLG